MYSSSLEDIGEKIKSLRNQPSDYPNLLWVIFVFLGGAINAVAIKNFIDYVLSIFQYAAKNKVGNFTALPNWQTDVSIIIVSSIAIYFIPIGFSFIFSRTHPEKKLIPPLFIQIVSVGVLAFFFYNQLIILFGVGYYAFIGGVTQDSITTYAFGSTVFTNNLVRHSFVIHTDIDRVKTLVISKQFRRLFGLKLLKNKKEETLKLMTGRRRGLKLILEIKIGKLPSETIINVIFWDEGLYNIKPLGKDDYAFEWALNRISLVGDYFSRHLLVKVEEGEIDNVEPLTNYIIDYFAGSISHFQEMATRKQVLLIVGFGLIVASLLPLLALKQTEIGIVVLLAGIALLADVAFQE